MDFGHEVEAQRQLLFRSALRFCRDRNRAEDLVQETMLKAIQKRHLFEPGSNLKAWLLTIMRNHFLAERRRAGRVVQDSDDMLAKTVAAQDDHAAAYEAKDVLSYLALVPLKMRRAVLMAAGGMQIDEIASREGVAEGTIKSRIHRGRTMLADLTGYEPTNLAETA